MSTPAQRINNCATRASPSHAGLTLEDGARRIPFGRSISPPLATLPHSPIVMASWSMAFAGAMPLARGAFAVRCLVGAASGCGRRVWTGARARVSRGTVARCLVVGVSSRTPSFGIGGFVCSRLLTSLLQPCSILFCTRCFPSQWPSAIETRGSRHATYGISVARLPRAGGHPRHQHPAATTAGGRRGGGRLCRCDCGAQDYRGTVGTSLCGRGAWRTVGPDVC